MGHPRGAQRSCPPSRRAAPRQGPAAGERQVGQARDAVARGVDLTTRALAIARVSAVVIERDRHAGPVEGSAQLKAFCETAARAASEAPVDQLVGFCHTWEEGRAWLGVERTAGLAAIFNPGVTWAADHLSSIEAASKFFIGMAPLGRGAYVGTVGNRLPGLRWALDHRQVVATAVTISSEAHLREVLRIAASAPATMQKALVPAEVRRRPPVSSP